MWDRFAQIDWEATPLGRPETWPESLRTTVRNCLHSPVPMSVWWGPELTLLYNDGYRRILGDDKHPWAFGRPAREVCAETWDTVRPYFEQVMSGGKATWLENEPVVIAREGRNETILVTSSLSPVFVEPAGEPAAGLAAPAGGRVGGVLNTVMETTALIRADAAGIGRDVTDATRAQEVLRRANASLEDRVQERTRQVRDLTRRLTLAEQEQRRTISQTLHDDLQQVLYGIELKVSGALDDPARLASDQMRDDLMAARRWLGAAIETTRELSVELSPPILPSEGLFHALQWLQRQMGELHGLDVAVEGNDRVDVPDDVRVLLVRLVRELLFNVSKHAGTDRATVNVSKVDGEVVINVADDGCGFDAAVPVSGVGLSTIRERIELLGGRLEVRSRPGQGTQIEIRTPLPVSSDDA